VAENVMLRSHTNVQVQLSSRHLPTTQLICGID
jgi:hypothetical protein